MNPPSLQPESNLTPGEIEKRKALLAVVRPLAGVSFAFLLGVLILVRVATKQDSAVVTSPATQPAQSSSAIQEAKTPQPIEEQTFGVPNSSLESAKQELSAIPWVKDLYLSPGHMNIGVIRVEKEWGSPMIGRYVHAMLKKHGVNVRYIRFVDIEEFTYQKKSLQQAEISKYECE